MTARYGMTVPLHDLPVADLADAVRLLDDLGFTDVWSSESSGADAFTPLAVAATVAPAMRLGTGIVPIFTRGPAALAQAAATLAALAPGRFALGLGTSSNVITEDWNAARFDRPAERMRDTVRFLRAAFTGARIDERYGTFEVRGFRLGVVPELPPPILVAALRPRMLALAGEADGAVINWLSAADVPKLVAEVHAGGPGREVVARIMVAPTTDADLVHEMGRRMVAGYLTVPVYRAYQRWLGRSDALAELWERWDAGDRAGAAASVPTSVVDELIVHGSPEECRRGIDAYVANGVTTPVLNVYPMGAPVLDAVRALGP